MKDVLALVDHAKGATKFWHPYYECNVPGLLLVGDHGVYLMSNGSPGLPHPTKSTPERFRHFTVYALGMDPEHDPDWWETRSHTYGGDDGCDFLPLDSVLEDLIKQKGSRYFTVTFANAPGRID